ncbi:cold-shock protein [Microvirga rosea]|uniref:cold-shock protein n=1 Tax=Microvirga rosea TaxID=2715425 RepID=UPI001D09F980|nr:cold shock domain-containing protein [Microvirga rosea]MCB8819307.1 cold shock domain-containing protein [Microvirga rosea]
MIIGKVKSYDEAEGLGLIQPDHGGQAVLVNGIAIQRAGLCDLVEGQRVSFETVRDRRSGMMAAHNIETI